VTHEHEHPDEDESVSTTLDDAAEEGEQRLRRTTVGLLATGVIAGIDVGIGVLAKLSVLEATGSDLLGGLAFGIGFIAILLGRSELFTENFLVPVTAWMRSERTLGSLVKLWGLTGVGNLVGGWVIMGIIVVGVPRIGESQALLDAANHFIEMGISWELFASAVLGGAAITLMTWMQQGSPTLGAKIVAAVSIGFVLAGTPLFHAVVTSLEMFGALQTGATFGYLDWLGAFGVAVGGNIVGGIGLVTILRLMQARAEEQADRAA
jgi:formate-nitrite transporter family protein